MVLAVAIAGKIGSGKTTVAKSLAKSLDWPYASFGDYVRKVVMQKGLPLTRKNLQEIGTQLLQLNPRDFCSSVLSNSPWQNGQNLIIDGLRHAETIDIIRTLVHPASLKIVLISVPEEIRLRRLHNRGDVKGESIVHVDSHSSEQQVTSILVTMADRVADGDKPPDVLVSELAEWIRSLSWNG